MSLKSKILAAKLPFVDILVNEWGETVRIQALTGRDRIEMFDALILDEEAVKSGYKDKPIDQMILQLIFALRDPKTGERILEIGDADALLDVSYQSLEKLYQAFINLNVVKPESLETVKKSSK